MVNFLKIHFEYTEKEKPASICFHSIDIGSDYVTGVAGFEPTNAAVKVLCLTT